MKIKLTLLTALIVAFNPVYASPISTGSGVSNGTYFNMIKDIKNYCEGGLEGDEIIIKNTTGSVENLTGMNQKKYALALVQEDVLHYYAKQNPGKVNQNRIKIVSGMHLETAHLLIPKNYRPKTESSLWSNFIEQIAKKTPKSTSLDLLKGQEVISSGGSVVSAKALSYFLHLNMKVHDLAPDKYMNSNKPIFLVGGQPYKPVEDLLKTGKFHLVSIDFSQLKERAAFYLPVKANYKVDGKMVMVNSFGIRAFLLGKSFRKQSRNKSMSLLATCINNNLEDLADDVGTNTNWESVYELENDGEQTGWSYFPLVNEHEG